MKSKSWTSIGRTDERSVGLARNGPGAVADLIRYEDDRLQHLHSVRSSTLPPPLRSANSSPHPTLTAPFRIYPKEMVTKAICVLVGDVKGTLTFTQEVSSSLDGACPLQAVRCT